MAWLHLFLASAFEIGFAISLKYSDGYSKLLPSAIATAMGIASVMTLSKVLVNMPIGIAYSVWTGVGVVGVNILGVILFQESLDLRKIFFIGLVLAGIYGLHSISDS